jgi:amino acid transporter/mannitol/fructose-specific phosphotransferase system IIA component (Ntr-type)
MSSNMDEGSIKTKLKKELGLVDIFCIASGAMISSGLFILPGLAYSKAGPAVILCYALASFLIIPAVFSKAELSTAMPKSGGTFFFIDRSMGPMLGTIGGFAAWFSLGFKSAFALVGIGLFTTLLNPGFGILETKLISVFFCIVFTIINVIGVQHTGKTQTIIVIGLISLLVIYLLSGIFFIDISNFKNFAPYGFFSIFSTAGLIFISFGGLTKICSVAEECKNPGRNIPLGMFLSWGLISLLYVSVITVTIGLIEPMDLRYSNTPISLAANNIPFFGFYGGIIMAVAAILAFISTANAGLLAASRNPMAMSKDRLIPHFFSKISKRGTPAFSIIFTSIFMISVIIFLDLENLVKTASSLKILLFLFVILSLIIMRESKIRNYRPKFKSPLYPWIQIVGIIGYIFIISQMGILPILFVGTFISFGFGWYWFYARDKIWREYTLLNVIERVTGKKSTGYLIDEELREILIERDDIQEKRFETIIENAKVIDIYKYMLPNKFALLIANELSTKLDIKPEKLYKILKRKETDSNTVVHPGFAILSHTIKGRNKFEIVLVRSKKGIIVSDKLDPIYAFFVIIASPDQKNFYLHSLMWLIQIASQNQLEKRWTNAKDQYELKSIILDLWRKRELL